MNHPIDHGAVADAFPEFRFVRALKPGGMKNAYVVERDSDAAVVLKVIRQPLVAPGAVEGEDLPAADDEVERISREMVGMNRVDSPHVIGLIEGPDLREIDGALRVWYLEPFISGGSLADHSGEPWEEQRVLALASDLFHAIDALWKAGIVHRDIKPDNVILAEDGHAVLVDLGIALLVDLDRLTGSFAYSPATTMYAAPEQLEVRNRAQIDFRTDLFAAGLVLCEMATGRHPFNPGDRDGYFDRLYNGEWDRAACVEVGLSPETIRLLDRLLAPAPSGRYRKMEFAFEALEECT